MNPTSVTPKEFNNGRSDSLLIRTSDGLVQFGYAHVANGKVSRWILTRCFEPTDQPTAIPAIDGSNYDLSVFKGRIEVVEWMPIPSPADLVQIIQSHDDAIEACKRSPVLNNPSIGFKVVKDN